MDPNQALLDILVQLQTIGEAQDFTRFSRDTSTFAYESTKHHFLVEAIAKANELAKWLENGGFGPTMKFEFQTDREM